MLSKTIVSSAPARIASSGLISRRLSTVASGRFAVPVYTTRKGFPTQPLLQQPLSSLNLSTPTRKYSTMSDHGNVVSITSDAEFQEKVVNSQDTIVVDCFANWCGPCKAIAPKVAEFSAKYPSVKFYQIDVDNLANTAADLGVRAMPSFILFKDGKRVEGDVVGANPGALENAVKQLTA